MADAQYTAQLGLDFIRGPDWKPVQKTRVGWLKWARLYAACRNPYFSWTATVSGPWEGGYLRVSMGAQPEVGHYQR